MILTEEIKIKETQKPRSNVVRLRTFRQVFAASLALILSWQGYYLASLLPKLPQVWIFPSGTSLIASYPHYDTFVLFGMLFLGLLIGYAVGPKLGNHIIVAGRALEAASAADKIAVTLGTLFGVIVTAMIAVPMKGLITAPPFYIGFLLLTGLIMTYLGLAGTTSMKNELLQTFTQGGNRKLEEDMAESLPTKDCKILDTNVLIDGRITEICRSGFIEGTLYVPGFVLDELQHIADSGDSLKRTRGRRGLDILRTMQEELTVVVRAWDKSLDKSAKEDPVDTRLVKLAKALDGMIVTNDFNLNKVAAIQGVRVLNINELANALKPVVIPGERMVVHIVKEGKEPTQGLAYLDDGTMIVIEDGRRHMGETTTVTVTSVLQTVAGKMIFARMTYEEDEISSENGQGSLHYATGSGFTRRGPSKKVR